MANGRPTKWSQELEQRALDYVQGGWKDFDAVPSHVGLCSILEITRCTLYDWAKDNSKNFSYILAKCNAEQERILLNMGLKGAYNSNIVKLMLGKHGYNEKQEVETTNQAPQKIEVVLVDHDKN